MTDSQRTPRGRRRAAAAAGLAGLLLAGCNTDRLVEVQTPDIIQPGAVQSVNALPSVFNAAVGDFGVAYQGSAGAEGQILYSGLLSDEILLSDTFDTRRQIDRRDIFRENANNEAVYRQLHRARVSAERSSDAYRRLRPNQASQAEALALAAYTYVFFAEHYCGAVPFSTIDPEGNVTPGMPQSTQAMLTTAVAKFDSAITIATAVGSTSNLNLARVGKARAQVGLGQYGAAAATVAAVPTTFSYELTASENSGRQNNGVFSFNRNQRRFSVASGEGTNGLPYRETRTTSGDATRDPRVLVVRGTGTTIAGFDGSPLYVAVKYSEIASPAVLANGLEARLIEAEAALQPGGAGAAASLGILNALRANTALSACPAAGVTLSNFSCPATPRTLAPLTDAGDQAGRVRQLFAERAFWLYLTSHRLGDMRRLARTPSAQLSGYGFGANTVFPVGAYTPAPGTNYGNNTSLPVPLQEESNPNFKSSQCDVVNP